MADFLKGLFGGKPNVLKPYLPAIRATELPMIAATAVRRAPRSATESRLGGKPWWPAALPYPTYELSGDPLRFLAQINFADLPPLASFPRTGLMQIFVGDDDTYGLSFDETLKSGFQCAYHTHLDVPTRDAIPPLADQNEHFSPLENPDLALPLEFSAGQMPVHPSDYRLARLLPDIERDEDLRAAYFEHVSAPRMRLGGYPTFLNIDPRAYGKPGAGDIALLTLDSTPGVLNWGGGGVAQFLIPEDSLRNRDFSKVHYGWNPG